jgi:hypothetical protein
MKRIECSKEAPWGIHQTLRDLECPRCGWGPDREERTATSLPQAAEQLGWALVIGGLTAASAAA